MNYFEILPGLPVRELGLVALVSAAVTFFATGPVRLTAQTYIRPASVRERDVHKMPVPRLGGIAILIGLLVALIFASKLPMLSNGFENSSYVSGYFTAAAILIAFVGAIDDAIGLSSISKFVGQVAAGSTLTLGGYSWSTFTIPSFNEEHPNVIVLDPFQGVLVAVTVVVIFINAINFIDGLDGLASGICIISATTLGAFSIMSISDSGGLATYYGPAILSSAILGASTGFLPHNFYPAKVFMGDSGSMLLGLTLAAIAIGISGQSTPVANSSRGSITLLTPIILVSAVMILPILDLILAVLRRSRSGVSIFEADKEHLHHRMIKIGHSHRKSTLIIWCWSATIAITTLSATIFNLSFVFIGALIAFILASAVTFFPKFK